AHCQNNLRQLAVGVQNYHDANKVFPSGRYGDYSAPSAFGGPFENSMSWSWLADILPYVEQLPVYTQGNIPNAALNASAATSARIPLFVCPSDPAFALGAQLELSHYLRNPGLTVGLTTYKGVMGDTYCFGSWVNGGNVCDPWNNATGLFYPMVGQNKKRMLSVTDGTSNTFMIGEMSYDAKLPGNGRYGHGYAWAHAVEACLTCAIPPNAKSTSGAPLVSPGDWQNLLGARSLHPGGVHFAMVDGSVQFIGDSIPLGLYRALATINRGEVASVP